MYDRHRQILPDRNKSVICVVSDTHQEVGHGLSGRTLEAVREADVVIHAGDFTTADALRAFSALTSRLVAVFGNADAPPGRPRVARRAPCRRR